MARWLAYGHPAWMLLSLAAVALALRQGLALRRSRRLGPRRAGTPRRAELLRRHVRFSKPGVIAILIGFAAGPVSMYWLRGHVPFHTLHALLGTSAAGLFAAAAWLGLRLESGAIRPPTRSRVNDAHALLGILAFLLGAVAMIAGFVLLP